LDTADRASHERHHDNRPAHRVARGDHNSRARARSRGNACRTHATHASILTQCWPACSRACPCAQASLRPLARWTAPSRRHGRSAPQDQDLHELVTRTDPADAVPMASRRVTVGSSRRAGRLAFASETAAGELHTHLTPTPVPASAPCPSCTHSAFSRLCTLMALEGGRNDRRCAPVLRAVCC
jgi:hypothetical protein